ncbi:MAG TPA: hypothetical protein VJ873_10570, partial [bacterium]|nr:hypothetical protein [bacterium]
DGDFEMDSTAGGLGVFGIAFRTGDNGSFYCFQMNENPSNADGGIPNWQVEKNTGAPSVNFSYPGCCVSNPGYTFGTFVHLQVVAQGNHFQCFLNGGKLYDFMDPTPFTNGGVGVRTYGIQDGNVVRIKNFVVNACPPSTPTATATPTDTPTDTPTATPTSTPTATPTATSILPPPALTHMPTPALTHIPPKLR